MLLASNVIVNNVNVKISEEGASHALADLVMSACARFRFRWETKRQ